MPPLAAAAVSYAVSAAVTSALTGILSATLASIVGSIAGKLVSGLMGSLMGKSSRMGGVQGSAPAYSPVQRDRVTMVRSSIEPHRVVYGTAKVSGALVYAASSGSSSQYLHLVIVLAAHEVAEIGTIYANDIAIPASDLDGSGMVTAGRFKNRMRIKKHLGAADQVADETLVAEMPAQWTSAHRLRGRAYIYVRLEWDYDTFPTSYPNFSAAVKGKTDIEDPRDSIVGWTSNWALCVRDYLLGAHGVGCEASEIDDASFIAAANIADEEIDTGDGTQKRYTCDGVIFTDKKPVDIGDDLLTAGAGAIVYRQGAYALYAGAYRTPTVHLDEDDLRGPLKVKPRMDRQELFNRVRGTYVDGVAWAAKDFPPVENALYVAQDGGEEITKDIDLPFTTDAIRCQRLAKIHLEKSRQGITVEMPAKLTAIEAATMETVTLTIARLGWSAKPFIVLGWAWSPEGGIDLDLQEEAAAVYDWASGDATSYDLAPDTDLADPFSVAAPTGLAGDEDLVAAADGTARSRLTLSWTAPADAFVIAYEIAFKRTTSDAWTDATLTIGTTAEIWDLEVGSYEFRVRARNSLGVRSAWTSLSMAIAGLLAPLDDVTGLETLIQGGLVYLSWSAVTDIRPVEYEIRRGPSWGVAEQLGRTATRLWPVSGAGTYWVSARSGAAYSAAPTSLVVVGDQIVANLIATYDQRALDWPGDRGSFTLSGDELILAKDFRTVADVRAVDDVRTAGDQVTTGTYTIPASHRIDLGSVKTATVQLAYVVYGDGDFRTLTDVRSFADIRSAFGEAITALPEIRLNQGDSPDWGDWQPFVAGSYTFKEIDARITLTTADSNVQAVLSQMILAVDVPDLFDFATGVAVGAGGATIAYAVAFAAAPNLQVTGIGLGAGQVVSVTAETALSFHVQILDSGGGGVSGTINWIAQGY